MSIEKQKRLLSYKPAIIVATPGRLWELMNDQMDPYLLQTLPMIDVLVLDEADRMIADGHFKEMRDILSHVYTRRVQLKLSKKKMPKGIKQSAEMIQIGEMKEAAMDNTNFTVGKNMEQGGAGIDMSNVQDLFDDDGIFEEIKAEGNIVLDQSTAAEKYHQEKGNKGLGKGKRSAFEKTKT